MANFFIDTKKKIEDLFVYIVSCGKSSKGEENDDDDGSRANVSRPPGQRPAPRPQTGR
ncbi:hypothetical protein R3W88_011138 [Solanum pinnatisectum]|uniref:Uncharacterized protein n=1 Tax=Solanum pinnatisectum TaxID=50273 RepID=A0AAV9L901_9SOLN|nr:hypothetical protein R3W88_011138 [Solanum pinnatisectum]